MPRLKSDGSRPVNKPVAEANAQLHRSIAVDLYALISQAKAHLPDPAQYRADPDRLGRLLGDLIEQHRLLLLALRDIADENVDRADWFQRVVASIRPGKPKEARPSGMLAQAKPLEAKPSKTPAKAAGRGPTFDRAVYRRVELRRAELQQQAGMPPKIKDALESLLLEVAGRKNLNASRARANYTRYLAAYGRGKKLILGK